jgi:hypothetical protein
MRSCQIMAGDGRGTTRKGPCVERVALLPKRPERRARLEVVHRDESAKRWSPRARLLFIVGASAALWLLIALIVASIW